MVEAGRRRRGSVPALFLFTGVPLFLGRHLGRCGSFYKVLRWDWLPSTQPRGNCSLSKGTFAKRTRLMRPKKIHILLTRKFFRRSLLRHQFKPFFKAKPHTQEFTSIHDKYLHFARKRVHTSHLKTMRSGQKR